MSCSISVILDGIVLADSFGAAKLGFGFTLFDFNRALAALLSGFSVVALNASFIACDRLKTRRNAIYEIHEQQTT